MKIYIYFISNDIEDRTCETQLNLQLSCIRSKYLNLCSWNGDYVDHKVYRKGKWAHRLDYSKENGEVLVRKEIPSGRVLGRLRYLDLKDCQMEWWLDKVTGTVTSTCQEMESLPKYEDAIRLLKSEITESLLQQVAICAQKIHSICRGHDGTASPVTVEMLFETMKYALAL